MSQYGNPPEGGQDPQQPDWGQQQPPQYGQPGSGNQPAYGQGQPPGQQYGQPGGGYASWGERVLATLWDIVVVLWPLALMFVGAIVLGIGGALASGDGGGVGTALIVIGVIILVVAYVWAIWRQIKNIWIDQGRTGYTYGKRKMGIRVIREQDGQPMGVGVAVARWLLHSLLNSCLLLDYLWPLWDPKSQTLTDKILGTVVIHQQPQQY